MQDLLMQCAMIFMAIFFSWTIYLIPGYNLYTQGILTVLGFGYMMMLFRKLFILKKRLRNLRKGEIGERLVEEQLDEIRKSGFDVFHDFILKDERGTENIDHIIVGPSGVFTLETKNWTGKGVPQDDRIVFDGEQLKIGTWVQDKKILKQPLRQAAKLQTILQPLVQEKLWVVPMLCFWDRYVQLTRFNPNGLQVVNQNGVGSFILSREQKYSQETVRKISAKLKELNRAT
ncbi:nuclease-related domain-containing protein [Kiritimatiellaeota bacterium B1221]|nr:nuclease-related domain-containing protein [Kiritimatiellaeota bacterium B1221]